MLIPFAPKTTGAPFAGSQATRNAIPRLGTLAFALAIVFAGCAGEKKATQPVDDGHDHGPPTPGNCGHIEADGFLLETSSGPAGMVAHSWKGEQSGAIEFRAGELSPEFRVLFLDADSSAFAIADTCPENSMTYEIGDTTVLALERNAGAQWSFRLHGNEAGATWLVLHGVHEEHTHFSTAAIPVIVLPRAAGGHAIRGQVQLSGHLADDVGTPTGTRVVNDADGVRVFLGAHGDLIDSTLTHAGAWEFPGLSDGEYVVSYRLPSGVSQQPPPVHLAGGDVAIDTLRIAPLGILRTYPNPFPYTHGVGVEFVTDAPDTLRVRALNLACEQIWSYSFEAGAGFWHIHWIGEDQDRLPMPPGAYWIVVDIGPERRYNLVFKEAD